MGVTRANVDSFDDLFSDFGLSAKQSTQAVPVAQEQKPTPTRKVTPVNNNSNKTADSVLLQSAQDKMTRINHELNEMFVEREDLIKLMQLAICTSSNLLMTGPPGSGKSMLAQEMCSRIEQGNYFQWMLNKTTDPSEILGSFSVKQLENDHFLRITTGKLPEAHIVFLDEIYKANSPTLNTLLTIMNEHIFYNDGKAVKTPLISLFGASNEPPEDETLAALHDRFLFRMNLQYVKDTANKKRMHTNYLDKRAGLINMSAMTTITLDEIKALQRASMVVKVPRDMVNKFIRLINDLDRQGIHVSDRRQNECFKVIQGNAVLEGRNQTIMDDFTALTYVLWEKEEQIPIIEAAITKIVNPYDDRFKDIKGTFGQICDDIEKLTDPQAKTVRSIESKSAIERLVSKLNKVINEASKNGKDCTEFMDFRQRMVNYSQRIIQEALGTSFPEAAPTSTEPATASETPTVPEIVVPDYLKQATPEETAASATTHDL